jgi:hypothetical protein
VFFALTVKKIPVVQNFTSAPIYPLPKTAQSCKRFPGFFVDLELEEETGDPRHGVRDNLLDWAMYALADQMKLAPELQLKPLEDHKLCSVCKEKDKKNPVFL